MVSITIDRDVNHCGLIGVVPREAVDSLHIRHNPREMTHEESSSSSDSQSSRENVMENPYSGQIIGIDGESVAEDELLEKPKPAKK